MKVCSKKRQKKKTSEVINKIIPSFNPVKTSLVWQFSKVDSRVTSRHQLQAIAIIKIKFNLVFWKAVRYFLLKRFAVTKTILKSWKEAKIGHGLKVTKW